MDCSLIAGFTMCKSICMHKAVGYMKPGSIWIYVCHISVRFVCLLRNNH